MAAWRLSLIAAAALLLANCATMAGTPSEPSAASEAGTAGERVTLALVLDGHRTQVDIYPPAVPTDAAVILAHGFTRSRANMAGHAARMARAGALAVVPDLPYLIDSRDNARALSELEDRLRQGRETPAVRRIVMVGFSAGGLAALLASGSAGVVGYVGLDPFDRPGHVGRDFARTLPVPAALLRGPPSACNAFSVAAPWAQALPRIEVDHVFESATHCDFEDPSDGLCRLVCGGVDPVRQRAIADELVRIVQSWLSNPTVR